MVFVKKAANPPPQDAIDRFFAAVEELNGAWAALPRDVKPWIDWRNRRVIVTTIQTNTESHTRDSLRDELERRGAGRG